jgi:hypothetical protein
MHHRWQCSTAKHSCAGEGIYTVDARMETRRTSKHPATSLPSRILTMKSVSIVSTFVFYSSVLSSSAQTSQTSQPPGLERINDPNQQKRLLHYWADYGCFSLSDKSEPNMKDQCKEACFPGGITSDVPAGEFVTNSQTCWLNGPESDYRTGKPLTDKEKTENPRTSEHGRILSK